MMTAIGKELRARYQAPDQLWPELRQLLGKVHRTDTRHSGSRRRRSHEMWLNDDEPRRIAEISLHFLTAKEVFFELYDQMLPLKEGEYRVVKHKYDAFFETDLDSILQNNRIKTIIIVGTATNVCCESTARSGFFRDYQVAFPSDCNASFDDGMYQASLKTIDMFFGRVMTTEELLGEMRNELGRNDRVAAE